MERSPHLPPSWRGGGATPISSTSAWSTALPAVCLLLADLLLPQQELYANVEYGFSLLAATGTVGCISYLLSNIFRLGRVRLGTRASLFGTSSLTALCASGRARSEDWPLLVALLFGSILILFSGLGGWVDARPRAMGFASPALPA